MSNEAVDYVWRFSPAETPAQLVVHLAIADVVNAQNGWRLWMTQEELAKKSGVSRKTVNEALSFLVAHGALRRSNEHATRGSAVQFRFVFARHAPKRWSPKAVTAGLDAVTILPEVVTAGHTEALNELEAEFISPGVAIEAVRSIGEKLRKGRTSS